MTLLGDLLGWVGPAHDLLEILNTEFICHVGGVSGVGGVVGGVGGWWVVSHGDGDACWLWKLVMLFSP